MSYLTHFREQNDIDVAPVYHQLVDIYISSESENDNENEPGPSTSTAGPSSSATPRRTNGSSRRFEFTIYKYFAKEKDKLYALFPTDLCEHVRVGIGGQIVGNCWK